MIHSLRRRHSLRNNDEHMYDVIQMFLVSIVCVCIQQSKSKRTPSEKDTQQPQYKWEEILLKTF